MTRRLKPEDVPFDATVAYRFLKIKRDSETFEQMHDLVLNLYHRHRQDLNPRFRYRVCGVKRVSRNPPGVELEAGVRFEGEGIARLLGSSAVAVVFLLTLGERIDEAMARVSREDPTEAYFLDGVASSLTEGVLGLIKAEARKEIAALGYALGGRYAPGYAKWPLEEQQTLFQCLRGSELDMRLSDTCYLIPQKSLSGVFSVRPLHLPASGARRS